MTDPIKTQPVLRFTLENGMLNLIAEKDFMRSAGLATLPFDKVSWSPFYYKGLKILNYLSSVIQLYVRERRSD